MMDIINLRKLKTSKKHKFYYIVSLMGSNRVANRFNRKLKFISKVRCISSFWRLFVVDGADERT